MPGASVTVSCAIRCLKLRERLLAILPVAEDCSDAGAGGKEVFQPGQTIFPVIGGRVEGVESDRLMAISSM